MPAFSISSRLPLDGACGDEESFGVYWEEEAHPATGFPFSRHLERLLDGRGGDLLPLRESALTDLSGYPDHLCPPLLM
jgi:hypothetical protein